VTQKVWGPEPMPMPLNADSLKPADLGLAEQMSGHDMINAGLSVKLSRSPQLVWIAYDALK